MDDLSIPVLAYHRIAVPAEDALCPDTFVTPRRFERQIAMLSALGYRTIRPEDLARARGGDRARLPPKPLLLTFDDGFRSVRDRALPVLARHGFTATIFAIRSSERRAAFWDGEDDDAEDPLLSRGELLDLLDAGWSVGAHGRSHRRLTGLRRPELDEEIGGAKRLLESELGREVACLAYPYGDYDDRVKEAVAAAGYALAFATESGDGGALAIPRRIVSGRVGLLGFARRLYQAHRLGPRS